MKPSLILINPWIYDFAAYDLWSKPLGLLSLAADLRRKGFDVHLIDCMDVDHPAMIERSTLKPPKRRQYGTGKFWRQIVPKPNVLKGTDRPYSRYGLLPEIFDEAVRRVKNPSAILVTSLMTYWYPGVLRRSGGPENTSRSSGHFRRRICQAVPGPHDPILGSGSGCFRAGHSRHI